MVWQDSIGTHYEAHYGDRVVLCFKARPPSVDALLREAAQAHGDREAIVAGEKRYTYRDFDRLVGYIAAGLHSRGLRPGDRVMILLGNGAAFPLATFGAIRAGLVVVPLSTREQGAEIAQKLTDCDARAVIYDADLGDRLPAASATPQLKHRFVVGGAGKDVEPFDVLMHEGQSAEVTLGEEDAAVILYTSGTTGKPKGAVLTHLSMVSGAMHYATCWGLTSEDRGVMAVPASHVTGIIALLFSMVRVGGVTILMPAFKAADFVALAAKERMTFTIMVPAMYHLCLLQTDMSEKQLPFWRIGGYGGSAMPVATIETLAEKFPKMKLANAYGATETNSPATLVPLGDTAHLDTVGRPVPCCEIRIMDDDGREVAQGESGEVWIKGAHIVSGYWNNPTATRDSFAGGFWKSGDIGSLTPDGYLRVFDRKKDMINRGGYKVYSAEVEGILAACPKIAESAVVGDLDPVLGERTHAYILRKDETLTADEVKAHCSGLLSDYKVPDFVTFIDQPLPRNANGKILKRALKPTVS